jgi:hypothetical protein
VFLWWFFVYPCGCVNFVPQDYVLAIETCVSQVFGFTPVLFIRVLGVPIPLLFLFFHFHSFFRVDFRLRSSFRVRFGLESCFCGDFREPFRMREFLSTGLTTCFWNLRSISFRFYTSSLIRASGQEPWESQSHFFSCSSTFTPSVALTCVFASVVVFASSRNRVFVVIFVYPFGCVNFFPQDFLLSVRTCVPSDFKFTPVSLIRAADKRLGSPNPTSFPALPRSLLP